MVDRDIRVWLPEYYQRFAQVSEGLNQHYIFRRWILGASISAFGVVGIMQRPVIGSGALLVGGLVYVLLDPKSPINIPGRKLYREQAQSALDIAQREGWYEKDLSDDKVMKQVKATVTLARQFAPQKHPKTPLERILSFDAQLSLERINFSSRESNVVLAVTRRALNFGEIYWEAQDTDYAKRMVNAIKIRRSALSRESHMSF